MNTTYKGFTIYPANKDGNGTLYYIDGAYGKGYTSEAAAKGAITRWVNANVEAAKEQDAEEVPMACKPVVTALEAIAQPSAFTKAKNDKGMPIAANPKTAQVYAEMDYFGMAKARDTRSRNKREGKYVGKVFSRKVRAGKVSHFACGREVSSSLAFCVKM